MMPYKNILFVLVVNNGLIVNFGTCPSGGATFPIAFTSTYYNIVIGHEYYNNNVIGIYRNDITSFTTQGGPSITIWFYWLAIGY